PLLYAGSPDPASAESPTRRPGREICRLARSRKPSPLCRGRASAIESDHVRVTHAVASKNIERRADGQVDFTIAHARDFLQITQGPGAARISHGDWRPMRQDIHQLEVHA